MDDTVAAIGTRTVNLVCRDNASPAGLPFAVNRVFRVGANAWVQDHERLLAELRAYLGSRRGRAAVLPRC